MDEASKKAEAAAKEAADAEAAEEAAAKRQEAEENKSIVPDNFDPERAMKTILNQRKEEEKLRDELGRYKAKEQAEEDAKKSRDELLDAREQKILDREEETAFREAASAFKDQAEEAGIADPGLALLVAKENGLLGDYDPKTGTVEIGKVDFDQLLEDHPVLAGDAKKRDTGEAGRRGGNASAMTKSEMFNKAVRGR